MEKVRLSVEISRSLHDRITDRLPWGIRAQIFRKVIAMVIDLVEVHGLGVAELILDDQLRLAPKGDVNATTRHQTGP